MPFHEFIPVGPNQEERANADIMLTDLNHCGACFFVPIYLKGEDLGEQI
jgi:hypothetical protein